MRVKLNVACLNIISWMENFGVALLTIHLHHKICLKRFRNAFLVVLQLETTGGACLTHFCIFIHRNRFTTLIYSALQVTLTRCVSNQDLRYLVSCHKSVSSVIQESRIKNDKPQLIVEKYSLFADHLLIELLTSVQCPGSASVWYLDWQIQAPVKYNYSLLVKISLIWL